MAQLTEISAAIEDRSQPPQASQNGHVEDTRSPAPTPAGGDGLFGREADDDDGEEERNLPLSIESVAPKKKKKSKKKPKSQRGLNAPTGFEEYYADAPLTPEQFAENQELYHPSLPFTHRILTAIQRFERRRKLTPEMRDAFYAYVQYGGVDVSPNQFQGAQNLEGMDKDQIVEALAQTSISADKDEINDPNNVGKDAAKWTVDFPGVMAGFLSRRAPFYYGFETLSQVTTITKVLTNFLNYLLHHNVCPEYSSSILSAREIVKRADTELWSCAEAQRWLPGDFNIACSTLFDGYYSRHYDGKTSWMPEDAGVASFIGMTPDIAREVVKFAIAGAASEDVYQAWYKGAVADNLKVVEVREGVGFEVTAIEQVDEETKTFYKEQSSEYGPVGRIRAKPWTNPDAPPEDLTKEEREALAASGNGGGDGDDETVYEFFIEEVVLQHLFVGMKMEATARRLSCGIWFFDEFLRCFVGFDTFLKNELMVGWREPRRLERKGRAGGEGEGEGAEEGGGEGVGEGGG